MAFSIYACGSPVGPTVTRPSVPAETATPALPPMPIPPAPTAGPETIVLVNVVPGSVDARTTSHRFTRADATFQGEAVREGNAVELMVRPPGSIDAWRFQFGMPKGEVLQPGSYDEAYQYPWQLGSQHALSVSVSRVCSDRTVPIGSFVVHEAVFGPGRQISRFHATFAQKCLRSRPDEPYTTGEIRIVGDVQPAGPTLSSLAPLPSPPEPDPPPVHNPLVPNMASEWAGRIQLQSGLSPTDALFAQNNSSITATLRAPLQEWLGTLAGTLGTDGRVSGTVTFRKGLGAACATSGQITHSGFFTNRQTVLTVQLDPPCPGISYVVFELDRACRLAYLAGPDGGTFVRCEPTYWPSKPPRD